jgi:methionyl-tRNA formyltransferase
MRIALFGQAPLAVNCVERLLADGHEIVAVYAPPDGKRRDALAARGEELGLRVIQRRYFQKKSGEPISAALESYRELGAELNVLASMTSFLPRAITDAPEHKSLCFHPSLLPRFRGGNAMQWQIILGERESGVSIFVPDEGVDTGPLVVQKGGVTIEDGDTTGTLFFKKLYPLGVEAMVEAVAAVASGSAKSRVQDESAATFQGLVDEDAARVRLDRPAEQVSQQVRGCDPQPGAFVRLHGEPLRLFDANLEPAVDAVPGTVTAIDASGLGLALRGGVLRCGRVRAAAGKEAAEAFAARTGLAAGDRVEDG